MYIGIAPGARTPERRSVTGFDFQERKVGGVVDLFAGRANTVIAEWGVRWWGDVSGLVARGRDKNRV